MSNPTTDASTRRPLPSRGRGSERGLPAWLVRRTPRLAEEWASRIQSRRTVVDADWGAVVGRFIDLFVRMLPATLGPFRSDVDSLWKRVAELFGTAAVGRGLAAGEAIEELQILRELVIRGLYEDQAGGPPPLRDVLILNRAMDDAVVHASVGHTDALFFQLLGEGDSAPADVAREALDELESVRREVEPMLGRGTSASRSPR